MMQRLNSVIEAGCHRSRTLTEETFSEETDLELGLEGSVGICQGNKEPQGLSAKGHSAITRHARTFRLESHLRFYP